MIRTINEGLGTLYDRFVKFQILTYLKTKYALNSVTEVGTGFPILESGGLGGDSLLAHELFASIQLVYRSKENVDYARKFFEDIPTDVCSYDKFLLGGAEKTDLLFSNNLIEFAEDLEIFFKMAKNTSKYLLFFEDNYLNFGHTLSKFIGKRFLLAPWVLHTPVRETTIHSLLELLKIQGINVLERSTMDFPFFAPVCGLSPFRGSREQRGEFSLSPLSPIKRSLIKVGISIENVLPACIMHMSHMLYIFCEGGTK